MQKRKSAADQTTAALKRMDEAYALHQNSRLLEARKIYEEILKTDPSHPDALYLLGVVALQLSDYLLAIQLIAKAISINPGNCAWHYNHGIALQALQRFDAAIGSYDRAITIEPRYAEAYSNRGNALQALQYFEAAIASYDQAVRINPGYAESYYNRGIAFQALNQLDHAVASFARAIEIYPGYADAHYNRGNALRDLHQPHLAVISYDAAIKAKPDYAAAYANRGMALEQLGQVAAAVASYDIAISLDSNCAATYKNRGNALRMLNQLKAAVASYEQAIKLAPDFAECYYNLGITRHELREFDAAVASYDRAIAINPDYAEAYCNRGLVLHDLMCLDAAVASYNRAIEIKPDYAEAYWNKSLALLLSSDFASGWPLYEWRWENQSLAQQRPGFKQTLWSGKESLQGKTILLCSEQGFGDTLQFARYASLIAEQAGRVIVEVPEPLIGLLRGMAGDIDWVAHGDLLPDFDVHCPLLSLPLIFKTDLATIPSAPAYLRSDINKVEEWRNRLGLKTRPRVGLVWSGSPTHRNDRNRSIALLSLLDRLPDGFEYVSLQKELRDGDGATLDATAKLQHFGLALVDFTDTAALCELMDFVISVDTSVAHLSGALGKATWVMLPFVPDWRWLLGREDSPWYSSMKLYRQGPDRQWAGVIEQIRADLMSQAQQ